MRSELLADGAVIVPFGDAAALGVEISKLLTNEFLRQAMRKRAYSSSRSIGRGNGPLSVIWQCSRRRTTTSAEDDCWF